MPLSAADSSPPARGAARRRVSGAAVVAMLLPPAVPAAANAGAEGVPGAALLVAHGAAGELQEHVFEGGAVDADRLDGHAQLGHQARDELLAARDFEAQRAVLAAGRQPEARLEVRRSLVGIGGAQRDHVAADAGLEDRKSTRLNSSH